MPFSESPEVESSRLASPQLERPVRVVRDGLEDEPPPDRHPPLRGNWPGFVRTLHRQATPPRRTAVTTLQVNLGRLCNQACRHCHLDAGPERTESMEPATLARVLDLLDGPGGRRVETVDITGGAPELHPHFRFLVCEARQREKKVVDRCNLTVLLESGQESTARFLARHQVRIVASLPCYSSENVDNQRGRGVFDASIEALRRLNRLGYGRGDGLALDLVYNPAGASLPGRESDLEAAYRQELWERFGIRFDRLLTMTNMPISRFRRTLEFTGQLDAYMSRLHDALNPATLDALMCRTTLSVAWDGRLFDCDFNQAAGIDLPRRQRTVWTLGSLSDLEGKRIAFSNHCYGCTAGAGSSCGGALA